MRTQIDSRWGLKTLIFTLADEMPHFETSEMAANSVKEFLPSAVEPHPPNYFQVINCEAETSAIKHNGQESRCSCRCGHLLFNHCLVQKWSQKQSQSI